MKSAATRSYIAACQMQKTMLLLHVLFASAMSFPAMSAQPPRNVIFSSGLYGSMPPAMYTDFLGALRKRNIHVLTVEYPGVVNVASVERVCREWTKKNGGTGRFGLLAHSSFDEGLLRLPCIRSAMLCDPVTLPRAGFGRVQPAVIDTSKPVMVTCAVHTYDTNSPTEGGEGMCDAGRAGALDTLLKRFAPGFLIDILDRTTVCSQTGGGAARSRVFFVPRVFRPVIRGQRVHTIDFDDTNHADLVDDAWVDAVLDKFGNTGSALSPLNNIEAMLRGAGGSAKTRARYREDVADIAADFFTVSIDPPTTAGVLTAESDNDGDDA